MGRGRAGALAALFLAALALRPQIVGLGPLIPSIQDDLDVSHAVVGLLGTIPVLCMGLFAPPAALLLKRVGTRVAIGACLCLIASFGLLRVAAPHAALIVVFTIPIGVGMGFAGALMPVFVKERFPDRPAFATGVYTTGIQLGSALSSGLAVPVAHAAGGWRASLAAFSAVTVGLFLGWLVLTRREPPHARVEARAPRLPVRSGMAWLLVVLFGFMGLTYYGLNAWLADSFVERGWSEASAGGLIAVLNIASLPSSVLVPWLSDRHGSRRPFMIGLGVMLVTGVAGLVLFPGGAYAWTTLVGLANGAMFPMVLTLPLDVSHRPDRVGSIVGMMLGVGYLVSAASPFTLGVIRDATGSFTGAMWALVGVAAVWLLATLPLSRERLQRARA